MIRLISWASLLAASFVLSPAATFGQHSDDYGFPIEWSSYESNESRGIQWNQGGSPGRGLFGSRSGVRQSSQPTYQAARQSYRRSSYGPPANQSAAQYRRLSYEPTQVGSPVESVKREVVTPTQQDGVVTPVPTDKYSYGPSASTPCVPRQTAAQERWILFRR